MKKSFAYIISWDEVYNNVIEIEKNFIEYKQPYKVFNSGKPVVGWVSLGDIRYYRQLYKALEDFDYNKYDYMMFVAGDINSSNWKKFFDKANSILNTLNVGVFAPHFTNSPWSKEVTHIANIEADKNLSIASQTDGILYYLHKDIVKILLDYFIYLEKEINILNIKSGWGMDYIWCALSISINKLIIRDSENIIIHPAGSSYSHGDASKEMGLVIKKFVDFCKIIGINNISESFNKIYSRNEKTTLSDFYENINIYSSKWVNTVPYHIIHINDKRIKSINRVKEIMGHDPVEIKSINAFDNNQLDSFYKENPIFKFEYLKTGEVGCFASHFEAWKKLINSDMDNILIFEDDIIIYEDFFDKYNIALSNTPDNWDVISLYVDSNQYERFNQKDYANDHINHYISRAYQDWSTLCYIISKNGAKKFIKFIEKNGIKQPVDWFIFRNGHEGHFNVYTFTPNIKPPIAIDTNYVTEIHL